MHVPLEFFAVHDGKNLTDYSTQNGELRAAIWWDARAAS
jgi:hypothetical protein